MVHRKRECRAPPRTGVLDIDDRDAFDPQRPQRDLPADHVLPVEMTLRRIGEIGCANRADIGAGVLKRRSHGFCNE